MEKTHGLRVEVTAQEQAIELDATVASPMGIRMYDPNRPDQVIFRSILPTSGENGLLTLIKERVAQQRAAQQ